MKKNNISIFQIVLYIVLGIGIVFAFLIFSGKIPVGKKNGKTAPTGSVMVWGTLSNDAMGKVASVVAKTNEGVSVQYARKDPATFQSDLVNALASGAGPDMILVTPADIIANYDRILEIPYESLPQSVFQSTFTDQASQFLTDTGVVAFPLVVDPLIMYYNRDILTSSFVVDPPTTWDEVIALNKKITRKDDAGTLSTETVALGTYDNVTHAKDLLANLIFQAGNKIVAWDPVNKKYVSTFGNPAPGGGGQYPVASALQFYTSFANPNDAEHYSWNVTLPKDRDQFIAGKLAIYFGYASELAGIRQKNPNLNFDVAMMPQRVQTTLKSTYGKMTGVAIMKLSKNVALDLLVAQTMAGSPAITAYLAEDPTVVPVRKDLLKKPGDDGTRQTLFYNSAIIAKSFLDPDSAQTSALFKKYINDINAGISQPQAIISPGQSLLSGILNKVQKRP